MLCRMARSTLADIAQQTGVTVPTVSKVLNGRSDVSPQTRVRILELLEEAGYERRGARRAGDRHRSGGYLDVVLNPVGKSWAIEVVGGVQSTAAAAGYDVVVSIPGSDPDWLDRVVRRGSRGLIAERWFLSETERDRLAEARIPFVVIDPGAEPPPDVPSVGAANWQGGYAAAEHLLNLGHERLAVIGGDPDTLASRARLDGFRSALASRGLSLDPELERFAEWSRTRAHEVGRELLSLASPPTAIFACSDRMASGIYAAARDLEVAIPGDVSVIGFDGLPEVGWLLPTLTTMRQPVEDMARTALQILLARAAGQEPGSTRLELSTTLVVGESTAPPTR